MHRHVHRHVYRHAPVGALEHIDECIDIEPRHCLVGALEGAAIRTAKSGPAITIQAMTT